MRMYQDGLDSRNFPEASMSFLPSRHLSISLTAAIALACLPLQVTAQRVSPSAIATPRVFRDVAHASATGSSMPNRLFDARRVADDTTPESDVAAKGALVGALAGATLGYLFSTTCSEVRSRERTCRGQVIVGSTVILALAGYGMGSIIDMGIAHDRARARARAAGKD
jgi:hypothetical protein